MTADPLVVQYATKQDVANAVAIEAEAREDADDGKVDTSDSRLSDARTPTAHASTHATAGSDALTPAAIGAAAETHTHTQAQVTDLTAALANKAPLASPALTGTPTAPTPTTTANNTRIATTAFVKAQITSGTTDLTAGSSALTADVLHVVYE
jgi:hypothetical protein